MYVLQHTYTHRHTHRHTHTHTYTHTHTKHKTHTYKTQNTTGGTWTLAALTKHCKERIVVWEEEEEECAADRDG